MRTITDATMYVVNGPKGPYYAIRENDSGMVLTARTEHAAALLANGNDMIVVDRLEISHTDLLKITRAGGGIPQADADKRGHAQAIPEDLEIGDLAQGASPGRYNSQLAAGEPQTRSDVEFS